MDAKSMCRREGMEQREDASADSFPANDPIWAANSGLDHPAPSINGENSRDTERDKLDRRVREWAQKLWREAGRPVGGRAAFIDFARTLIAIEDNPRA
jgi:hypothetical protein